jgi:hypothetical protein
MRVRTLFVAATLGLVALAGCQKLSHEKTYKMEGHSTFPIEFDAPRYAQKLTVTVKPTRGPVSAYLCKMEDKKKVEDALMADKEPAAEVVLGSAKGKGADEEITLEGTVPKQTEFVLVLFNSANKANEVSVKVVGR